MNTITAIAHAVGALANASAMGNTDWADRWAHELELIEKELPSGSGFDSGTQINTEKSKERRIVLDTAFHHMNDNGMYDGWTEHPIAVIPAFGGFDVLVGGRNRNGIKEYMADVFWHALERPWTWSFTPKERPADDKEKDIVG